MPGREGRVSKLDCYLLAISEECASCTIAHAKKLSTSDITHAKEVSVFIVSNVTELFALIVRLFDSNTVGIYSL